MSSNRREDSEVDINDIDINMDGIIGDDGGIELAHPTEFLNQLDV